MSIDPDSLKITYKVSELTLERAALVLRRASWRINRAERLLAEARRVRGRIHAAPEPQRLWDGWPPG